MIALIGTDCEVKLLRLLLIGPSLGQAGFAEIGFTSGFDWLHAVAVLEALRDIIVLHSHHVLNGGQSSLHGFLHLNGSNDIKQAGINTQRRWKVWEAKCINKTRRRKETCPTSSFSILSVERRDCSCWHLWIRSLSSGDCAHITPIYKWKKLKLNILEQSHLYTYSNTQTSNGNLPCLPCGTESQSELVGRRHCCRSPSVSVCPRWLQDSLWLPLEHQALFVWMFPHSVQQTSRSSALGGGWHGSPGHSTITHADIWYE